MRITNQDKADYNRLKRNLLNKIKRVQKEHNINLASEIDIKPLEMYTRKEFNAFKEKGKRMLTKTPRWQFVKLNDRVSVNKIEFRKYTEGQKKAEKKALDRLIKYQDTPIYENNRKISTVSQFAATMKNPDIIGVKPPYSRPINEVKSRDEVLKRIETFEKFNSRRFNEATESRLKENFINAIKIGVGDIGKELIERIENIPNDDFTEIFTMNRDMMKYFNHYHGDINESIEIVDNVNKFVDRYYNNDIDMSFKNARMNIA